ncbi:Holliday junction DNA helicase RuvB C-terminal domain-containing protein [Candidatus Similichlamydia epinepheli]|uniref:Holliday junction DNA helicase RuvB C-terminal domain-containing protein n=1 Tax=Candidatus Similichlamydia epinepheli TaxID=1903953 RepID=UPI000D3751BE|nr:Holliday junction DNA helicase RuvB C-terminal domain-containing protein [Candidatus Similichlamydia epinepheli]
MKWKGTVLVLLLFRLSKESKIVSNLTFIFDQSESNIELRLCILIRLTQSSYRHGLMLDSCRNLSRLKEGELLFLDEIHSLNRACSESLYNAMDNFDLRLLIERNKSARSLSIKLKPFTLIGATTFPGKLSKPFLSRFEVVISFEEYSIDELKQILLLASRKLDVEIDQDAAYIIASRSRGTPRVALHFLKWSRRFVISAQESAISRQSVLDALDLLGIDSIGLNPIERKIIYLLEALYGGGPVGVQVLASHLGESVETVEQVYESHLLKEGLLVRSSRGRCLTQKGRDYISML